MTGRFALVGILSLGGAAASAQVMETRIAVPMRDGVVLRATVLRPDANGRFPTLVYRTPYAAADAIADYTTFTRAVDRGYAVVIQDVRGRYESAGEFNPYAQEGRDGYDTIEWAAAQRWSTGDVGTFGLSYPGAVQWLAAVESPPHLKAMVPAMTFSRPTNFWYAGGLPDLSWPAWIWMNIAPNVRQRQNLPGPRTYGEAREAWRNLEGPLVARLQITNVPELRSVAPWYLEWLSHPPNDPWWAWADLTGRYGRTSAAVLNISGWHDEAYGPEGALTNHLGLVQARRGSDARSFLILGPWTHGVHAIDDRSDTAKSGERSFGGAGGLDYDETVLRFMDRYVRGKSNGVDREPRVRVFVMGENVWRTGDTWPLRGTTPLTLSLGRVGQARGSLTRQAFATQGSWTIGSDPLKPIVDEYDAAYGAHDYRRLAERPDVMLFESEPLREDLRVVGNVVVRLTVSVDAPDADIYARLFDVAPDGTAWNLMSPGLEVQRLSNRPGAARVVPNEPTQLVLSNLLTGNLFRRGHKVRLVIMPSFHPHFSRNLHTGKRETESADARKAKITVHFGGRLPSAVELPVVR